MRIGDFILDKKSAWGMAILLGFVAICVLCAP